MTAAPPSLLRPDIGGQKARLIGIDVTRGLALLGMMAVHVLIDDAGNPKWVSYIANGHSAATFAVLAGVGLSLTTGRARVPWAKAGRTAAGLAGRAAAIGAIGLALGCTDGQFAYVILAYYAVLFVLAIPLVLLRTRTLVLVGVAAAVVVPVLSQWVRPALPVPTLDNPSFGYLLTDPLGLLSELLVTGAYPALPWMAYICAGLVVGRLTLSSAKVARRLLIWGVVLGIAAAAAAWLLLGPLGGRAALELAGPGLDSDMNVDDLLTLGGTTPTTSWWWLATGAPHTGAPLDLLGTIGGAVALLGAMLLLGHLAGPSLRRVISVVTAPLAAAGAMTLTLYTATIVFMNSPLNVFDPVESYVIQIIVVLLFGLGWRHAVGRGPLETAVTAVANRARSSADRDQRQRDATLGAQGAGPGWRAPMRSSVVGAIVAVLAVAALAEAGCSSSGSSSASVVSSSAVDPDDEQLCQARDQLKTSQAALTNPSLRAGGATAIKAAVDKVQNDLDALSTAAQEDYKPPVDAVQSSLQQLQTAVGNLGNGKLSQNLQTVGTAIATVGTTSADLFTQLEDTCGS